MNNGQRKDAPRPMMGGPGRGGPGSRMHAEKPKSAGKTLMRLVKYIGASRGILIAILVIMSLVTLLDLAVPWIQGEAINSIVYDKVLDKNFVNWNGNEDSKGLLFYLTCLALLYVLSAILSFFSSRLAIRLSLNTVYKLRKDLFKKISKLPIKYTDTHRHGDIMSRMTNDVENVSHTISQSISSVIIVGAYITLFCLFTQIIFDLSIFKFVSNCVGLVFSFLGLSADFANGFICGIFEMTNGCKQLSNAANLSSGLLATGLVSFGGISIIMQSLTFLNNTKIKARMFVFTKFVHAIFSMFIFLVLFSIFGI